MDSAGFRPKSDCSEVFLRDLRSKRIGLFPVIGRSAREVVRFDTVQRDIDALLRKNGITTRLLTEAIDTSRVRGAAQYGYFVDCMKVVTESVLRSKYGCDYYIMVEALLTRNRSNEQVIGGIQFYIVNDAGENAHSFLMNSHHRLFSDARLKARADDEREKRELIRRLGRVVVKALKEQLHLQ